MVISFSKLYSSSYHSLELSCTDICFINFSCSLKIIFILYFIMTTFSVWPIEDIHRDFRNIWMSIFFFFFLLLLQVTVTIISGTLWGIMNIETQRPFLVISIFTGWSKLQALRQTKLRLLTDYQNSCEI